MTPEEAIKHFEEDLKHIRQHLKDKDKDPEFIEDMKRWEKAEEMAIEALRQKAELKRAFEQAAVATSRIEQETEIERDITRLESRMARIEEIFVVLSKGLNIGTKAQHGWGLDPDDEKFLRRSWVELYKELYGAPEEKEPDHE